MNEGAHTEAATVGVVRSRHGNLKGVGTVRGETMKMGEGTRGDNEDIRGTLTLLSERNRTTFLAPIKH